MTLKIKTIKSTLLYRFRKNYFFSVNNLTIISIKNTIVKINSIKLRFYYSSNLIG